MSYNNGGKIVNNGLTFYLDAGNPKSYDGSQTGSWFDLGPNKYICSFTNMSGSVFTNNFWFSASLSKGTVVMNTGSQGFGVVTTPGLTYASLGILTNAGYTLEGWCNVNNSGNRGLIIGGVGNNQGITVGYGGQPASSFNFVTWYNNTASAYVSSAASTSANFVQTGSWYHVVGVYQYSPVQQNMIYINGILQGTSSYSNFVSFGSVTVTVGGTNYLLGTSPSQYQYYALNGAISATRIYNRALSATEILQNYNAHKGRFGLK